MKVEMTMEEYEKLQKSRLFVKKYFELVQGINDLCGVYILDTVHGVNHHNFIKGLGTKDQFAIKKIMKKLIELNDKVPKIFDRPLLLNDS